jgi:hypothetical protein
MKHVWQSYDVTWLLSVEAFKDLHFSLECEPVTVRYYGNTWATVWRRTFDRLQNAPGKSGNSWRAAGCQRTILRKLSKNNSNRAQW